MKKNKSFLTPEEKKSVENEIMNAELKTSGEIRVHILNKNKTDNIMDEAGKWFKKLKMHKTRDRNGVLLIIAPHAKKFAIFGDVAINEKIHDNFWNEVRDKIQEYFVYGRYSEGIKFAVKTTGSVLERFFPIKPDDVNELPNEITESD